MLDIIGIEKTFGTTKAVAGATFSVAEGELVCLLGPSGCGKSTLLRMIAGLADQDRGRLVIEGRDVSALAANRRPTAMVFQSHALWNHMTVAQNVAFGLRVRRLPRTEIARKVTEALELVGLAGFDKRRPTELSGGQAQRVALARCLVVEPKVLLMDEPFSALDAHLRKNLREELKHLQRRLKLATIFVTHDQEEAMELADRIVVMSDGRIEQIGPPSELYLGPQTLTVANFIGSMNACDTRVDNGRANWFGASIAVARSDGPAAILCRPEDMKLDGAGAPGQVSRIIDLGPMMRVTATTEGGQPLIWLCSRAAAPEVGDQVKLAPTRLHVYRDGALLAGNATIFPRGVAQLESVSR